MAFPKSNRLTTTCQIVPERRVSRSYSRQRRSYATQLARYSMHSLADLPVYPFTIPGGNHGNLAVRASLQTLNT